MMNVMFTHACVQIDRQIVRETRGNIQVCDCAVMSDLFTFSRAF